MAGNYIRYAELSPTLVTPADMPVDMHELIALCAPAPSSLAWHPRWRNGWADVRGTYIASSPQAHLQAPRQKPLSDDSPHRSSPVAGASFPRSAPRSSPATRLPQHPYGTTPSQLRHLPHLPTRYMTPTK